VTLTLSGLKSAPAMARADRPVARPSVAERRPAGETVMGAPDVRERMGRENETSMVPSDPCGPGAGLLSPH